MKTWLQALAILVSIIGAQAAFADDSATAGASGSASIGKEIQQEIAAVDKTQDKFDKANKAMTEILQRVQRCTEDYGAKYGLTELDFSVSLSDDRLSSDFDGGLLKNLFCLGSGAKADMVTGEKTTIICSACLSKYYPCQYKDGQELSNEERLDCLVNYKPDDTK